jgi:hypothetical protein
LPQIESPKDNDMISLPGGVKVSYKNLKKFDSKMQKTVSPAEIKKAEQEFYKDALLKKNNAGGLLSREDYQEGQLVGAEEETAPVDTYPNIPQEEMEEAEASQLPDEEMEGNYLDFIIDESLVEEEQTYLMNALEADPQLSVIFDKVVDTASEFSGAGEVIGPGTGVSDSIPARLSDGEFVMTRKATDAIGPDNLQVLMDDAEMAYDYDGGRELKMAFGGVVEGDDEIEDSKDSLSQTDEEIRKVMIGSNRMPSVR